MLDEKQLMAKFGPKVALDLFYRGKDISETDMLITTDHGGKPSRDEVFYEVLKMFDNQPINIFQVGAIESFDSSFRFGSGWSDIFFANYIKKHGGELTICDPDLDHLANSIASASLLDYNINSIFGRAEDFMTSEDVYDLYYLDGSNDPEECDEQMDIIKDSSCVVLCDDFYTKAAIIKDKFDWQIRPVATIMGILDLR
tara:strand:+ start:1155 stop:1751 length:597 start_codon:yes stop_codon:yes gene_type:complete